MLTPQAHSARRRLTRAYLYQEGYVALVALLFLVSAVGFFLPTQAPDGSMPPSPPLDYFWNGSYLLGSIAVLVGLLDRRVGIEVAGHLTLAAGMIVQLAIATEVLGLHRVTILLTIFIVAAILRTIGLLQRWQEQNDA